MLILSIVFALFGAFEIVSNLYHLTRGGKARIAASARRQHGEIPAGAPDGHFVAKAAVMLVFGILFVLTARWPHCRGLAYVVLGLFGAAGASQIVLYRGYWRTFPATCVHCIPLAAYLILVG